mgnify:CR=1 FL=1
MEGQYTCSHIVEIEGVRIGIVGYTTEDTPTISNTGKLIFQNVIPSINAEIRQLRKECQIVIGVGHYGYQQDKDMVEYVDVDVIIGGHSHSQGCPPGLRVTRKPAPGKRPGSGSGSPGDPDPGPGGRADYFPGPGGRARYFPGPGGRARYSPGPGKFRPETRRVFRVRVTRRPGGHPWS